MWMQILPYFLLVIGFVLLTLAADWLVDGASALAKRMDVPDLIIGLTIVAFGTSAPELVVSTLAAIDGNSDIAVTNVLGSCIINILIILGISAIIYPLTMHSSTRMFEIPLSILAGIVVMIFYIIGSEELSRTEGIILLAIFVVFIIYSIHMARRGHADKMLDYKPIKPSKALLLIVIGLAGLIIGGHFIVDSAVKIATAWGVPKSIIGVTIVAFGTSLPELATSAMAAYKKHADLAIGNVVGSNIFNVFFILGISAVITPIGRYENVYWDSFWTMCAATLLLLFGMGKKHQLQRLHGIVFITCYAIYLGWLFYQIL